MVSQKLVRDVVVWEFCYEDFLLVGTSHSSVCIIPCLLSKLASSSALLLAAVFSYTYGGLLRLDCVLYPIIRSAALGLYLE